MRFYFPASAPFTLFSPSVDAGWGYTSEVTRHSLSRAKTNSALTVGTRVGAWSNTAATKAIDRQLFSPQLAAQTISGTVSMMAMAREFATTDNVDRLYLAIKVVDSSGSVVATLLAFGTATGAATTELLDTAVRCATWANGATLSSYTCSLGDRIMVEVGFSNSTAATSPEAQINWGDPTAGTDATVGDNTTTTARVGWIEFSAALTFAAPTVTSVSPTSGRVGSTLTVNGTGFMPGSVVAVDGSNATTTYVSQTQLTCIVPTGSGTGKTVAVTNTDTLSGSLSSAFDYVPPGPTEVVFTNAGGHQIEHWETYNSSGDYIGTLGIGSTFNQPNAGNRPAVDTSISPAGQTMLSCDGVDDMVGDFGTGGIIATGNVPTWASPNIVVEHFIVQLPSTPDNSTIMMMIDLDSDGWNRNQFGAGIVYRTGAISDSAMSGGTPYFVTCEHDCASGVSTMTINGVAQATTGTNSSSTRTDILNYKLIGAKGDLSDALDAFIGGYGIGYGTTWGSTERAALYQAQQDWFNGVATGVTGTLTTTLQPLTVSSDASAPVQGSLNVTLAALTVAASATAPVTASAGVTLEPLTVSAFGSSVTPVTATLAVTLAPLTVVATATAPTSGAISATLAPLTVTALASAPVSATLNVTLAPLTVSPATASAPARGSLTATLAPLTVAAVATATVRGSLNATLAPLTVSSAASAPATATASVTLQPLVVVGIASAPAVGSFTTTLAPLTVSAVAGQDQVIIGTLDVTLQPLTVAASGTAPTDGTLATTLAPLTVVAVGTAPQLVEATLAVTLDALTVVAVASVPVRGEFEVTLAPLTIVAVGGITPPLETNATAFWHRPTYVQETGTWPDTLGLFALQGDPLVPFMGVRNGYPAPDDGGTVGSLRAAAAVISDVLGAGDKTLYACVELDFISSERGGFPDYVWLGGALLGDLYGLYLGLFVYRTGTLGAYQYWLSYYEWDGETREAKVEITSLLNASGGGRLIAQGRKVDGHLQVRANDQPWFTGDACGPTEDVSGSLATGYTWEGFAGVIKSLGTWDRAITDTESLNLYAFANTVANTVWGRLEVTLQPCWVEATNIAPDLGPPTHASLGSGVGAVVSSSASPLGVVVSAPATAVPGVVVQSRVRP